MNAFAMVQPTAPTGESRSLYFFLSYARSDDNLYVRRLFRDLSAEVRVLAGLDPGQEVGFCDTHSIELGARWSVELVNALSRCHSFLALCSPRYFRSPQCGREWQMFSNRVRAFEAMHGSSCQQLIPLRWLSKMVFPGPAGHLQYDNDALGEVYHRDGLRQLLRLDRHRDSYREAVTALAHRLVENANDRPLPPAADRPPIEFDTIPSAFHPTGWPPEAPARPVPSSDQASHVRFIVAAPTQQEVKDIRSHLEFYGDSPAEWAPYRPALPASLASFACDVAARGGLSSDVASLSVPPAADCPDQPAEPVSRGIVILLVDPWAPQLTHYHHALADHESRCPADTAMVPHNPQDQETHEHWRSLSNGLHRVFAHRVNSDETMAYRSDILSHHAFGHDLQDVLESARNRVFRETPRLPRQSARPPTPRPILEGP